jgi:hypothetical protein
VSINKVLRKFASLKLLFWTLLWLMILLILGTIVQKDIGIYQAKQKYFSSWIIWLGGFFPMPGGQMTMGMIFLGLLSQLIFKSTYKLKTLGLTITHLGSLLLLLGGMITGYFSIQGSMVIEEGLSSSYFQDYHRLEIAIIDTSKQGHDLVYAFDQNLIKIGKTLEHSKIPFKIKITNYCRNCSYVNRSKNSNEVLHGFSKKYRIKNIPMAKDNAKNRAGISFKLTGTKNEGVYTIFENMQVHQSIKFQEKKYYIQIRHKRYELPFKLTLLDFQKINYASTSMAKNYRSILLFQDTDVTQRTIIQMNEPLRYKGYTLYQSSYIQESGREKTILSVVHNLGRIFPYISSIIICIGLVIHLVLSSGFFSLTYTREEK